MPTYPTIPITQFYNNAADYDSRAAKVELGKGGVIDRSRIHFFNSTRKSYSISAVLKDRDTLQNFLETNRGKPFEFRYDGSNSAGLYICKTWSWNWVVFVEGAGGVWNFSATFEQVFRPGWVSETSGVGTLTLPPLTVSGTGFISINPSGSGSLITPIFTVNGSGEVIQSTQGLGNLTWPTIQVSGSGSLTNNGNGAIVWPTVAMSGVGIVSIMPDGEGNLEVPIFSVDGSGNISVTHTGSGTLITPDVTVSGAGSLTMRGSGSLETSAIVVSGSGTALSSGDPLIASVVLLLNPNSANGSTTFTDLSPTTPHTLTAVGNAQHSTSQAIYGATSIRVDGAGDSVRAPNNTDFRLNGDFCVELWVYPLDSTAERYFISHYDYGSNQRNWRFGLASTTGHLHFQFVSATGVSENQISAGVGLAANTWQHIAVSKSGSTSRIFINGDLKASGTALADLGGSTAQLSIGSILASSSPMFGANCHIGPIRITKGAARYTASFTPPSGAFPTS